MSNKRPFSKRKMRTETVTLPVDPNDGHTFRTEQNRLLRAAEALDRAQVGEGDVAKAGEEVAAARDALDAALAEVPTVTFTFRALSPAKLEGLHVDHPPTPRQIAAFKALKAMDSDAQPPDYDPDTYTPALLEAACVKVEWSDGSSSDGLSQEDATDLWENSSTGDIALLMAMINGVNNVPSLVSDLGKDSGVTQGSAPSPTTAVPEGSPTPTS